MSAPRDLLATWLRRRLPEDAAAWLAERRARADDRRDWTITFALVPRKLGKAPLELDHDERAAAAHAREGWHPEGLRTDEAARLLLLLDEPAAEVAHRVETVTTTADTAELVTIARGLPLYPDPERHRARAAEGVRTNIRDLFVAVAHHNPYPAEQLAEEAWNQMVLKALFIEVPLHPILGLDRRANPALARMLVDYAAERRAAGRSISPELWRCVGPHADERARELLAWILHEGDAASRDAAALALHAAGEPGRAILREDPDRAAAAAGGRLDWDALAS